MKLMTLIALLLFLSGCTTSKVITPDYKKVELYSTDSIPALPFLMVTKTPTTITAAQLEQHISKQAKVEWLAEDSVYFLPTKQNMDTVILYLDDIFRKFGIHFIPESLDCDDFARTKTALSKLIISQTYQIEASPAIFTIFVFQKKMWANVPAGGGHALIAYACTDANGATKVFIWEPQSTEQISVKDYPNKDQLFYIGSERTENPNPEPKP